MFNSGLLLLILAWMFGGSYGAVQPTRPIPPTNATVPPNTTAAPSIKTIHSSIHSRPPVSFEIARGLDSIPAALRRKAGYTLDKSPPHRRANRDTSHQIYHHHHHQHQQHQHQPHQQHHHHYHDWDCPNNHFCPCTNGGATIQKHSQIQALVITASLAALLAL